MRALWFILFFLLSATPARAQHRCGRIVSLAPSVTETLFALELGPNVVGATRFCNYPDRARMIERIGGFLDPNLEKVVRLSPSVVVGLNEQYGLLQQISRLGIPTLILEHRNVDGILDSVSKITGYCQIKKQGTKLLKDIKADIDRIKSKSKGLKPLRVLIGVGRNVGDAIYSNAYLSGSDGFYSDLIRLAGGVNAFQQTTLSVGMLSPEAIIQLNPDLIIEITAELKNPELKKQIRQSWEQLSALNAVQKDAVFVISEDYGVVPGPRMTRLLVDLFSILSEYRARYG